MVLEDYLGKDKREAALLDFLYNKPLGDCEV